ncbi:MAG: type IV secretion protein IcmK [Gammaproteobacteria bacterium]|nr:type IV secretion protein IcmK [Gammaproteobacteria bacterium]
MLKPKRSNVDEQTMKQKFKLLLLLLLIGAKPIQAAVLGGDQPLPPAPQPGGAHPSSSVPSKEASGANPLTNALSTPNRAGTQPALPKDLSQLTPQQSQQLIEQTKNLNPEQLQAIAKTIQSQAAQAEIPQSQDVMSVGTQQTNMSARPAASSQPAQERPIDIEEMKRDAAFNSLMTDVLPLSPDQIMKLHKFYDLTLQAKATTVAPPPNPNFTSIVVTLDPGSQPPVIRLSAGFVTSVLFVDTTGAPWPVTAYSIGDPQGFNIQWDQKGNALFIQSIKQYAHGNLAVRLWGLDTPVMITLVSGQKNVDFRVDLQVMGRGPDAKPPIVDTTLNAKVNPLMINILDGIPPRGSIKLGVSGGYGDAWFADGRVYFRTKLTVLSPAWTATVASPDGTHVYEMMQTPFILATLNGRTVDIKLSGL